MPENNGVIGLSTVSPESQAATDAMFAGVDAASNSPVMSTTKNEDERKRFDAGIAKLSGPFGTILNVVNRPFSAVMGALDPIDAWAVHNVVPFMEADGQKAPTALQVPGQMRSNIKDALWNGKPFGTKEMLDRRDLPLVDAPKSLVTLAAMAGDIGTGLFIDPIGKVKLLGELDDGARVLMSVANKSVLPQKADNILGAIGTKAKEMIDAIPGYRTAVDFVADTYRTQRQTEDKYAGFFNDLKSAAFDLDKGLQEKQAALEALASMYKGKGIPDNLFDFAYAALENPNIINDGATIKRVIGKKSDDAIQQFTRDLLTNRVAEIDTTLDDLNKGLFFKPTPPGAPAVDDLVLKFDKVKVDSIAASAVRQEEIETKLRSRLWDSVQKKASGVQGLDSDIAYLQRQNDALDAMRPVPGDEPTQYVQNALRLRLLDERVSLADVFKGGDPSKVGAAATSLLDRAGVQNFFDTEEVLAVDIFGKEVVQSPEAKELIATLLPWQKHARSLYDEAHTLAGADLPKLPFDNYMKHMRVDGAVSIFPKSWNKKQRFDDVVADYKRSFVASGIEPVVAESLASTAAKKLFQSDSGKASKLSGAERRGIFEPMLGRKIDLDGVEINASDAINYKVNMNAVDVTNRMVQDAERFKYATGVFKQAVDQHGIDSAAFDALSDSMKKQFVPVEFRLKFLPEKSVDPFDGKFIPKDMMEAINDNLGVFKSITDHKGTGMLVDFLDNLRRSYSMTTLAVFPGKYTRDFTGAYINGALGGTMLHTPTGKMAYGTAVNLYGKSFDTHVSKLVDTEQATQDAFAHINKLFPDANMDAEKMRKLLYISDLTGQAQFRDIGMAKAATAVIGQPQTSVDGIFKKFAKDMIADANPMNSGDMARSGVARGLNPVNYFLPSRFDTNPTYNFFMNEVARPVEDIPRAAVYMDHLMRNGERGLSFADANTRAVKAARHYIGDPTAKNISGFERNVVPLGAPFYKWSRHNIPLQIQTLAQEPGKYGTLARSYRNQYDQYDEDIDPENSLKFIKDNVGVPTKMMENKDGDKVMAFGLLAGWIPAADIGQMANMLNPDDKTGVARGFFDYTMSQTNGWIRASFEELLDYDSRMREKISEGNTKEMFGVAVSPSTAHAVRQIRFLNEVDRLNPGNAFTHLGHFFGTFEGDRPARNEVEQSQRFIRLITGLTSFENDEEKVLRSEFFDLREDMLKSRSQGRGAARQEFTSGLDVARGEIGDTAQKLVAWRKRWSELQERQNAQRKQKAIEKKANN